MSDSEREDIVAPCTCRTVMTVVSTSSSSQAEDVQETHRSMLLTGQSSTPFGYLTIEFFLKLRGLYQYIKILTCVCVCVCVSVSDGSGMFVGRD